jgi:mannan endo-1,4-beta-mannosidase
MDSRYSGFIVDITLIDDIGIAALFGGIQGITHYQWTQPNLTAQTGTTIEPDETQTTLSPDITRTGTSPNDGYGGEDTA